MRSVRSKRIGGALLQGSAPLLVLALFVLGGCTRAESQDAEPRDLDAYAAAGNVIDSVFPLEEEMRRFRMGMREVTELSGGASSVDELVDTFLRAVERADTAAVSAMAITREEFAWLYFPYSIYATPPYELAPGLVWMQLESASSKGFRKILSVHGGNTLYDTGVQCPDDGSSAGEGRIWDECVVLGRLPGGEEAEERLFGSILEVGGRYKFVSFANGM
jgi:hypothetical protein